MVDVLARAAEAGLRVGFATGRMRAAVEPLWRTTQLPGPHVLHNGALVRYEGRTLASWPLEPDQVRRTVGICEENGWYVELYVADGYLVSDRRPEAAVHWDMLHQLPDGLIEDLGPGDEVSKATIALFDEDPRPVVAAFADVGLRTGAATSPHAPGVWFINVTRPDVHKGRALRTAAEHIGVPLAAVVAVGDGGNDLPMLEVAGTAIAMGQAEHEVIETAHLVVPPVDEDGVARALEAAIGWAGARA